MREWWGQAWGKPQRCWERKWRKGANGFGCGGKTVVRGQHPNEGSCRGWWGDVPKYGTAPCWEMYWFRVWNIHEQPLPANDPAADTMVPEEVRQAEKLKHVIPVQRTASDNKKSGLILAINMKIGHFGCAVNETEIRVWCQTQLQDSEYYLWLGLKFFAADGWEAVYSVVLQSVMMISWTDMLKNEGCVFCLILIYEY